ncbi:MAG: trehalose-phosphatase [Gammaproteobacteria bacterium]|nr:trehalose-phosphatase [Gammaproteobacteria bacterium]MCP5195480.1 trehalose-phosphatase [Gammaproteobacteria bacterium]
MDSLILKQLTAAYRAGQQLVLAFDYDGTLTPLAAHPRLAHLDPVLRGVLARLAARPRITIGIISGRGLDNLIGMVGLPGLSYGGSTGLELELAGKRRISAEALASRVLLDALCAAIEERLTEYPGAWVEKKPFGFTVHYRQLATDRFASLRTETLARLAPQAANLQIMHGPLAIEVLPAIGQDKGTALRAIVTHSGAPSVTVLYAGDAVNDEPALTAAMELGGIALGIGLEPPAVAEYRLADPAALRDLLMTLVEKIAAPHSDQDDSNPSPALGDGCGIDAWH